MPISHPHRGVRWATYCSTEAPKDHVKPPKVPTARDFSHWAPPSPPPHACCEKARTPEAHAPALLGRAIRLARSRTGLPLRGKGLACLPPSFHTSSPDRASWLWPSTDAWPKDRLVSGVNQRNGHHGDQAEQPTSS